MGAYATITAQSSQPSWIIQENPDFGLLNLVGNKNCLLSFHEFLPNFKIKCNFLQYFSNTSTIPGTWNNHLKEDSQTNMTNLLAIDNLTWKTIHRFLVDNQDSNPPMAKKRLTEIAYFNKEECRKIYSLPLFCSHKRNNFHCFSIKLFTTYFTQCCSLQNEKVEDPFCPYYTNVGHTVVHLFLSCPVAVSFWSNFTSQYQCFSKETLTLSKQERNHVLYLE